MRVFLATFHTHLSALRTARTLQGQGIGAQMMPVPRELSSACGTCVRYESENGHIDALDGDVESLYMIEGNGYQLQQTWD